MLRRLILGSAVAEIVVGVGIVLFPSAAMELLLGAPVEGSGAVASRLAGIAVAAMGAAWWGAGIRRDTGHLRSLAASFIGYNAGVGVLFAMHAGSSDATKPVSWLVAVTHLLLAAAYRFAEMGEGRGGRRVLS